MSSAGRTVSVAASSSDRTSTVGWPRPSIAPLAMLSCSNTCRAAPVASAAACSGVTSGFRRASAEKKKTLRSSGLLRSGGGTCRGSQNVVSRSGK